MFSSRSKEPRNLIKSAVFKHADPSNLGRSLLESIKDHLLNQARCDLMKQEHQVGSLNNCTVSFSNKLMLKDWNYRHNTDMMNLEQVRPQEELSMKEKLVRDTQIRSMHELGEMKRAQELRVDGVSVQKLRENP